MIMIDEDLTRSLIAAEERNEMNRHWAQRPGKIAEHANPAQVRNNGQKKRSIQRISTQDSKQDFSVMDFSDEDTTADSTLDEPVLLQPCHLNETVTSSHNQNQNVVIGKSTTPQYDAEDPTDDMPHNGLLDTAKSGYEQAKHGIGHGIDSAKDGLGHGIESAKNGIGHGIEHAGHKLGLWDEETSTAPYHKDPVLGFESEYINDGGQLTFNSTDPNNTNTNTGNTKLTDPDQPKSPHGHGKLNHKSTAGFSAMGVIIFAVLILWFGCVLKRRIQRKKGGRYAHLEDGSNQSGFKDGAANGGRGILAREVDEFEMRDFGASDGEERAEGKVTR